MIKTMDEIVWFNYRDDKSDVWNIEFFMIELGEKLDALVKNSNIVDVLKFIKSDYDMFLNIRNNVMAEDIIFYFRRQKIKDWMNGSNLNHNLNFGKLMMAGFTGDNLKTKIDFLNSQWNLIPSGYLNIKSYVVVSRLLSFLSSLNIFTEMLRMLYYVFAATNLCVSFLNVELYEIFHRLNGDLNDDNDSDEFDDLGFQV